VGAGVRSLAGGEFHGFVNACLLILRRRRWRIRGSGRIAAGIRIIGGSGALGDVLGAGSGREGFFHGHGASGAIGELDDGVRDGLDDVGALGDVLVCLDLPILAESGVVALEADHPALVHVEEELAVAADIDGELLLGLPAVFPPLGVPTFTEPAGFQFLGDVIDPLAGAPLIGEQFLAGLDEAHLGIGQDVAGICAAERGDVPEDIGRRVQAPGDIADELFIDEIELVRVRAIVEEDLDSFARSADGDLAAAVGFLDHDFRGAIGKRL
jgi:hypothetical protein